MTRVSLIPQGTQGTFPAASASHTLGPLLWDRSQADRGWDSDFGLLSVPRLFVVDDAGRTFGVIRCCLLTGSGSAGGPALTAAIARGAWILCCSIVAPGACSQARATYRNVTFGAARCQFPGLGRPPVSPAFAGGASQSARYWVLACFDP
jgi:hypothetical protein